MISKGFPDGSKYHIPVLCGVLCVFFPLFSTSGLVDLQEEGHTGFLIHLPPAVLDEIFLARRIQPFLSLVDREVLLNFFLFFCTSSEEISQLSGFELTS